MRVLRVMALGFILAASLAAKQASAVAVINASSGLGFPHVTIDFDNGLLPNFSTITNQLAGQGVTFGANFVYFDCDCNYPAVSESGVGVGNQAAPVGPVYFNQDVSAAVFSFITGEGASITKFSAFHNGNLVETFNAPTDDNVLVPSIYGFRDIVFNEIRFEIIEPQSFVVTLDNLQYRVATVPLPPAVLLLISALSVLATMAVRKRAAA